MALSGQSRFQLGQWRAGQRRDYQLAGLIADDAAECADIKQLPLQRQAIEVLAAAAANAQWCFVMGSGTNTVAEGFDVAGGG